MDRIDREELASSLGARLRTARQGAGLTQDELAGKLEVVRTQISGVERGAILPPIDRLDAHGRAVGLTLVLMLLDESAPADLSAHLAKLGAADLDRIGRLAKQLVRGISRRDQLLLDSLLTALEADEEVDSESA
jgi:transcriptional regulator with XRE-family HTH domain